MNTTSLRRARTHAARFRPTEAQDSTVIAPNLRLSSLGRQVLSRYGGAGVAARFYLNLRWRWTPYERIAACVPSQGLILDLGSGHGLLSLAMGLSEPGRTIVGIDHDPQRVLLARQAAAGIANLDYATGSLLEAVANAARRGRISAIVILDALHYLNRAEQEAFLAHARTSLQPHGVLVIRDVDAGAGKNFLVNRVYEKTMTGLGFTRAKGLTFRTQHEWLEVLAQSGFQTASEPCSRFPFADRLFVCTPSVQVAARAA